MPSAEMTRRIVLMSGLAALAFSSWGCVALLAGGAVVGAEAGYVAAQKERSAGETVSDQWIFTKVTTELATSNVPSRKIEIQVRKGVVTLRGVVESESHKDRALAVTRGVKGVKKVVDKMFVAP